ncbi:RPM1-interacting protein 4, partial [Cucurbita argyrosperma subsp. argyrosperma]
MSEKGQPLPKFGEWDVNNPASAEGFTVIFNKARDEKKSGGQPESPGNAPKAKPAADPAKPQAVRCFERIFMYNCLLRDLPLVDALQCATMNACCCLDLILNL